MLCFAFHQKEERKILIFDLLLYLVVQVGLDLMMDLIYRLVSLLVAQVGSDLESYPLWFGSI